MSSDKLSRAESRGKIPFDVDHEKGDSLYHTTSGPVQGDVFDESYGTTHRGLKSRHAQMIALGGTVGTGLFVGSGQTLARGGPAFRRECLSCRGKHRTIHRITLDLGAQRVPLRVRP